MVQANEAQHGKHISIVDDWQLHDDVEDVRTRHMSALDSHNSLIHAIVASTLLQSKQMSLFFHNHQYNEQL